MLIQSTFKLSKRQSSSLK
ncbi:uncharacterized protein FFNC_03939 [Fusarium fujikuroi]|nr:uncharacterized protein FFNC_03939 [Fusarium fujikuroi]